MSVDTVEIERSQKNPASLSRQLDQVWLLAAVVKERLSSKKILICFCEHKANRETRNQN